MNLLFFNFSRFAAFILLAMVFLITNPVRAQMFSVEEEEPVPGRQISTTGVYIGLEPAEFTYQGGMAVDPSLREIYEFDGSLLRLRFESVGFEAYIGIGGNLTGIDDIGYFDAGAKAGGALRLFRSPVIQVQLPLQIKSTINSVSNNENLGTNTEFRQGTLEFGGGGEVIMRFNNQIRLGLSAIPNYGFSFATGGTFGGDVFDLETGGRLYVDRFFGELGLTAGIDYTFKRFDVDENEFDYNFRSFSFLLGITF